MFVSKLVQAQGCTQFNAFQLYSDLLQTSAAAHIKIPTWICRYTQMQRWSLGDDKVTPQWPGNTPALVPR